MTTNQTITTERAATPRQHEAGGRVGRRRAARIAGISYLAMFVLAIFANFVVREGMIDRADTDATVANISGSIGLFRLGLVAFLAIFVLDVVIAWALHVVFREGSEDLSLATALFRIVYSVFLGVAVAFLFQAGLLLSDPAISAAMSGGEVGAQTMLALQTFEGIWLIGLVAFGVHLVLLGALINRSGLVTKVLGALLMAAGVAYGVDTLAHILLEDYEQVRGLLTAVVAVPSMLGEGWLGVWLVSTKRLPS